MGTFKTRRAAQQHEREVQFFNAIELVGPQSHRVEINRLESRKNTDNNEGPSRAQVLVITVNGRSRVRSGFNAARIA